MRKPRQQMGLVHAAMLLIGGTRRVVPVYCRKAVRSFPLHKFVRDTASFSYGLTSLAFQDIIKDADVSDEVVFLSTISSFSLQNLLTETVQVESLSLTCTVFSFNLFDVIRPVSISDGLVFSIGIQAGNFNFFDNVKVITTPEALSLSYSISSLELQAP